MTQGDAYAAPRSETGLLTRGLREIHACDPTRRSRLLRRQPPHAAFPCPDLALHRHAGSGRVDCCRVVGAIDPPIGVVEGHSRSRLGRKRVSGRDRADLKPRRSVACWASGRIVWRQPASRPPHRHGPELESKCGRCRVVKLVRYAGWFAHRHLPSRWFSGCSRSVRGTAMSLTASSKNAGYARGQTSRSVRCITYLGASSVQAESSLHAMVTAEGGGGRSR